MNRLKKSSKRLVVKSIDYLRIAYHRLKGMRLKNKNITIIASDCFGTFIYHDFGLKFNSPTINLFFSPEDFIVFVKNLEGFVQSDVQEIKDETTYYPKGSLTFNDKTITINFMHYDTFEKAKEKWNERKKRIDFQNVMILLLARNCTKEFQMEFDSLPYQSKLLITDCALIDSKSICVAEILKKNDYRPGQILEYKSQYSLKRYMDDIDYITYMNSAV